MAETIVNTWVQEMVVPPADWRARALAAGTQDHSRWFADAPSLHQIEWGGADVSTRHQATLRIVAWNAERLKYVEASASLLHALDPDVVLLTEVDRGMARSGNRHAMRELADLMGMTYRYGVEFIELGLGDDQEAASNQDQSNVDGLHGNGVLSRVAIDDAWLIRLETSGRWFDPRNTNQPRVGGRMAVAVKLALGGRDVVIVTVHLESHTDAQDRCRQIETLVRSLETVAGQGPVVIGGDFNTKSMSREDWNDQTVRARLMTEDPNRRLFPVPHEPLFEAARRYGYGWRQANAQGPTERPPPSKPPAPLGKIDWFLTRGVEVSEPAIHAAVDRDGRDLADHEVLSVRIA
ncbi:MAG: endonuclease/exonuclease/phosphatase family protein [Geminicoccaceae bacterium]